MLRSGRIPSSTYRGDRVDAAVQVPLFQRAEVAEHQGICRHACLGLGQPTAGHHQRGDPLTGPVERRARSHAHRRLLEEVPDPAPRASRVPRARTGVLGCLRRCRFVPEHNLEQAADRIVYVQYFFDCLLAPAVELVGDDKPFLGSEVAVHRRGGYLGRGGDLLDRDGVERSLVEQVERLLLDRAHGVDPPAFTQPGSHEPRVADSHMLRRVAVIKKFDSLFRCRRVTLMRQSLSENRTTYHRPPSRRPETGLRQPAPCTWRSRCRPSSWSWRSSTRPAVAASPITSPPCTRRTASDPIRTCCTPRLHRRRSRGVAVAARDPFRAVTPSVGAGPGHCRDDDHRRTRRAPVRGYRVRRTDLPATVGHPGRPAARRRNPRGRAAPSPARTSTSRRKRASLTGPRVSVLPCHRRAGPSRLRSQRQALESGR